MSDAPLALALLAVLIGCQPARVRASEAPTDSATSLRVMTFNVLHSSVRSPAGPWRARRPLVARAIREARPDIACLQEVSGLQLADLEADLPEYTFVSGEPSGRAAFPIWALAAAAAMALVWAGLRRRPRSGARTALRWIAGAGAVLAIGGWSTARFVLGDYLDSGEFCPILIRSGRFEIVRSGSFWLSDRPERDASAPRWSPTPHLVTWARIERAADRAACTVYATHLGVLPWAGRGMANALRDRLDRDWSGTPQIVAADLNSTPDGAAVRALIGGGGADAPGLRDAWADAVRRDGPPGTFHWGIGRPGPRLDYILVRPALEVTAARAIEPPAGSRRPSDHLPVVAEIALAASAPGHPRPPS